MEWFDQGKIFWQADGMNIEVCEPLSLTQHNEQYKCFSVGKKKIEWFWVTVLHHLGTLQGFGRTYHTTLEEAQEETRKNLVSQIEYWNKTRFKNNPIELRKD